MDPDPFRSREISSKPLSQSAQTVFTSQKPPSSFSQLERARLDTSIGR